jgi:hypothetical protein
MGIQDVLRECLEGNKVNFSTLIKKRMVDAPPLRVGVDLSVYAHQGIRAQSIQEIYAMDFVAQPPMDISGYAWAMLDEFLYAIELFLERYK